MDAQSEVVVTEPEITEVKPKKAFDKRILLLIPLAALVALTAYLWHVFSIYQKATVYKHAYDIVQEQLRYCDKINSEKQERKIFDYCDEFNTRFKSVEKQ